VALLPGAPASISAPRSARAPAARAAAAPRPRAAPLTGQRGAAPQLYAGGSVGGAVKLNYRNADVVMNWMGGLHHAKKAEVRRPCDAPSQPCMHARASPEMCFG
jgi:hypothetical protein